MELMNNYKEMILIVDLDAKECDTQDLDEELVEKGLGGAGITTALYEQYQDRDPLVIGNRTTFQGPRRAACSNPRSKNSQ